MNLVGVGSLHLHPCLELSRERKNYIQNGTARRIALEVNHPRAGEFVLNHVSGGLVQFIIIEHGSGFNIKNERM